MARRGPDGRSWRGTFNCLTPLNIVNRVYKVARSEWGYRIGNPLTGIVRPKPRILREAFRNAKDTGRVGFQPVLYDSNMAAVEGSIGAVMRRIAVPAHQADAARQYLREAGEL